MFVFAFLIAIYSYLIFFLGVMGWLYRDVIIWFTIIYWGSVMFLYKKNIRSIADKVKIREVLRSKLVLLFIIIFLFQAFINLIGTLGPELGFDALWYHLTLPKLYLENHLVYFIPGGLLYYSAMPKLAEMLYIGGLSFGNEITIKFIHFTFGLLTCLALYKLSRKFFTRFISLIAVTIFYANLVVAWESISAYVDLVRAFFEVMALWGFVNWWQSNKRKWLIWSAVMLGLTITTKVLAMGSLLIFVALIIFRKWRELRGIEWLKNVGIYTAVALFVPLPWFVFSFINTGNPVHPFFSDIYKIAPEPLIILGFFNDVWNIFMYSPDPISPLYVMFFPFIVWLFIKGKLKTMTVVGIYSVLAIIVWYFTPRTGGGRFMLPYLPALSLLCAATLNEVIQNKKNYGTMLGRFLLIVIIGISFISIGYRFIANKKYIPVIIGTETKDVFLTNNLNFAFGDFYDVDGYFKENIRSTDTVLLYGFHNLYYVDFPFIDATWKKPEDTFNYIATQKSEIPKEFNNWILVYENEQTMVKLYKEPERVYTYK